MPELVIVSPDQKGFLLSKSRQPFVPVGFNYDHDEHYRLIEDYWEEEWGKVVADFHSMKALGANIVRIHLQVSKFLASASSFQPIALEKLDALLQLAAETGVYINLVGLGCYHRDEVPGWYDALTVGQRWDVQAYFWEFLARRYAGNPVIFCFDLMNEPIVPVRNRSEKGWLGPEFDGKSFIQFIALDGTGVERTQLARSWIRHLKKGIRKQDPARLVTVGLVDWSLDGPGMTSGFIPSEIVDEVDYIGAHLYPVSGDPLAMIEQLKGFLVGKPLVIDETFHLKCSRQDQELFLQQASSLAQGFLGFYTDQVADICCERDSLRNGVMAEWLEIFTRYAPVFQAAQAGQTFNQHQRE